MGALVWDAGRLRRPASQTSKHDDDVTSYVIDPVVREGVGVSNVTKNSAAAAWHRSPLLILLRCRSERDSGRDLERTENRLPITDYQLPITNYQLPITNYPLPITNYLLLLLCLLRLLCLLLRLRLRPLRLLLRLLRLRER